MLKNLISPIQSWLLSQGKCVGCGMPLSDGEKKGDQVTCKCKRIYKKEGNKFRRALLNEVK